MNRRSFLESARRQKLDELLVAAIERAERDGNTQLVTELRRDRLRNALDGFRYNRGRGRRGCDAGQ